MLVVCYMEVGALVIDFDAVVSRALRKLCPPYLLLV